MPTSRIVVTENVLKHTEAVAPKIVITWDPGTTNGLVEYHVMDLIKENGVRVDMVQHKRLRPIAGQVLVTVSLAEILSSIIDVPTGAVDGEGNPVTTPIPGAVVVGAVKAVFDKKFNELLDAQDAADAANNPSPEPTP